MPTRPIYIQCCLEGPDYNSGPMPTIEIAHVPTVVLQDLEGRIREELNDRKRITMLVKEHWKGEKT